MGCPRCDEALVGGNLAQTPVSGCTGMARTQLPVVLQSPTAERFTEVPQRVADAGGGLCCPTCSGPMTHDGYMGSPFVMIDRCAACDLLWIDAGELPAMTHQYARMQARSDESAQHRKEMAVLSVLHWRFNPWVDGGP